MVDRQHSDSSTGRSSRGVPSSPSVAAVSAGASGSTTSAPRPASWLKTTEPAFPTRDTATRTTYRQLLMRGLSPDEAANLTAFLCGIPVGEQHWKLLEVNRMLFLRALARTGSWGATDGSLARSAH